MPISHECTVFYTVSFGFKLPVSVFTNLWHPFTNDLRNEVEAGGPDTHYKHPDNSSNEEETDATFRRHLAPFFLTTRFRCVVLKIEHIDYVFESDVKRVREYWCVYEL